MSPRLLMVADDCVAGGAFKVGERLAPRLANAYRVTFACDGSPLNASARRDLCAAGVEIVRLFAHAGQPGRARYDLDAARALLARAQPDKVLLIDSAPLSNIAIKDAARAFGVPYFSALNFADRRTPPAFQRFDSDVVRTANAASATIFVSAAVQADFAANYPQVSAPGLVIPNGVPNAFFAQAEPAERARLRRNLGLRDDEVALLLAGRIEPRKGQRLALAAIAELRKREGPPLRLLLAGVGDDAEVARLHAEIDAHGLRDPVRYLGVREDVPELMDACDIVLAPSAQEADPLVSKEAMAKGRPVVASDLPGVREQGHAEALLVPAPRDAPERTVEGLVAAIDALRRDPDARRAHGRALREIAERSFKMSGMVSAYLNALNALPPRAAAPPAAPAAPAVRRWMRLREPNPAAAPFKDGWSDIEADGVWSVGARARMSFAFPEPAGFVDLSLRVSALATAARPREIGLFVNERRAATWTFNNQRASVRSVRSPLPSPKRFVLVRVDCGDPVSPFDLGSSDDRRPLGIHVSAWRIDTEAGRGIAHALRRFGAPLHLW